MSLQNALAFFQTLRADQLGWAYYEVAEPTHSEHRVYSQSNYLLRIIFYAIRQPGLGYPIQADPLSADNDPTRVGHLTGDRWCVLDGCLDIFYLRGRTDADSNDELALLSLYWYQKNGIFTFFNKRRARQLYEKLKARFDPTLGVLQMDQADRQRGLFPVYKIALLGILARKMGDTVTLARVRQVLAGWQEGSGGWRTDRKLDLTPDGVCNLETTALCVSVTST